MLKKLYFFVAFIILCLNTTLHARDLRTSKDSLVKILQRKHDLSKDKDLISFLKDLAQTSSVTQLDSAKIIIYHFFDRYELKEKAAFTNFFESLVLNKSHNLLAAKVKMEQAVLVASRQDNAYLQYMFYSHLAFIETDLGNFTSAVYNYRAAKKEALELNDKYLHALLDVNISDLYYKASFYTQSLSYLDQAQELLRSQDELHWVHLTTIINYNKCENYFRIGNYDSLKVYHDKLFDPRRKSYKIETYRQRTTYYLSMLKGDYALAVKQIKELKAHPKYITSEVDDQNLADAFYKTGQLDSAKVLATAQLVAHADDNHPEVSYHLYELLGQIAEKKGDLNTAISNYKMALKQSQQNNGRISQMGNVSSQMKVDEKESIYNAATDYFKKQRIWLIFFVVLAGFIIFAIALIYRNVKQKRRYEKLVFVAKKEELAFINSHEVRKHLTNILGIIDVLKNSENKLEDYKQVESYLLESADRLDKAIKNFSDKLTD